MRHEHHLTVPRTARYYTLGEPAPHHRELVYVCHGYAQLAGYFIKRFECIANRERLIVAPEALSRFYLDPGGGRGTGAGRIGATWMTREDRMSEIADQRTYLDLLHEEMLRRVGHARVSVTVLGFSQGTATAARWLQEGKVRAARLILWGGTLPPEIELPRDAAAFGGQRVTIIAGTEDTFMPAPRVEAEAERLKSGGIAHDVVTFEGGHALDDVTLRRIIDAR